MIEHILNYTQKSKCFCIHEIIQLTIIKMKVKMKSISHRNDINRPKPRYSTCKKCLKKKSVSYKKKACSRTCFFITSRGGLASTGFVTFVKKKID